MRQDALVTLRSECGGTRWRTGGEVKGKLANGVGSQYCHTTSGRSVSSIINADAHTSAAPAVDWTDSPADLNGLVRLGARQKLVSSCVPSGYARALHAWELWPVSSLSQGDQLRWIPESTISKFEMSFLTNCTHLRPLCTPTLCLLGQFYIIWICSMSWAYCTGFLGHLLSFPPLSTCQQTKFYDLSAEPAVTSGTVCNHNLSCFTSPFMHIRGVPLSPIHYSQSHTVYMNRRHVHVGVRMYAYVLNTICT